LADTLFVLYTHIVYKLLAETPTDCRATIECLLQDRRADWKILFTPRASQWPGGRETGEHARVLPRPRLSSLHGSDCPRGQKPTAAV